MSCSFGLTQHCCAPTLKTNVYRDWFRDSIYSLIYLFIYLLFIYLFICFLFIYCIYIYVYLFYLFIYLLFIYRWLKIAFIPSPPKKSIYSLYSNNIKLIDVNSVAKQEMVSFPEEYFESVWTSWQTHTHTQTQTYTCSRVDQRNTQKNASIPVQWVLPVLPINPT